MSKSEMKETLYQVAKMRAEFELLKNAVMNSLDLNYSGDDLTIRDSGLIIEVMRMIDSDHVEKVFNLKKKLAEVDELVVETKETDNEHKDN